MIKNLLFILAFFVCRSSFAQCDGGRYINKIFPNTTSTRNITYSVALNASNVMQRIMMDVYEPASDTAALRPLIILMHGGAYWTGTKDYESQIAMGKEFAQRGFVLSSATYRLEPSFISLIFPDLMLKA